MKRVAGFGVESALLVGTASTAAGAAAPGRCRRLGPILVAALVTLGVIVSGCGGGSARAGSTSKPAHESALDQHKDNPSSSQHKDNPTRVRVAHHSSGDAVGQHKDNPTSKNEKARRRQ